MTDAELIALRRQRRERERRRRMIRNRITIAVFAALLVFLFVLIRANAHARNQVTGKLEIPAAPTSIVQASVSSELPGQVSIAPASAADKPEHYRPAQEAGAAEVLAKTVWGEARGCSTTEQAAVVWCILNRVDSDNPGFPDDIIGAATQAGQFHGYSPDCPVDPEILSLVEDVLYRWSIEDACVGGVGRVLPEGYCWFSGNGKENTFRDAYEWPYNKWDWSAESPYEE